MPWKPTAPKRATTYDSTRPTADKRLYDHTWRRWRAIVLQERPLCEDCLEEKHAGRPGSVEASQELHHIRKVAERPDLRLVRSNVRALCKTHHSRRTARGE